MTLSPWIEANQGLFSISLSAAALGAAFGLAWLEHRRALAAERARTSEPAQAALALLDSVIAKVEAARESEGGVGEAIRQARNSLEPMKQIASTPVPSAGLILALHGAADAVNNLCGAQVVAEDAGRRARTMENRLTELRRHRPEIERWANHETSAPPKWPRVFRK